MKFILLTYWFVAGGSAAVNMQEFDSKFACESARTVIAKIDPWRAPQTMCIPKGTP